MNAKAKTWLGEIIDEPAQWQIQINNLKPYGPYIGLGYWEEPVGGRQSIYQYDCIHIVRELSTLTSEFNDVAELERNWIEEG